MTLTENEEKRIISEDNAFRQAYIKRYCSRTKLKKEYAREAYSKRYNQDKWSYWCSYRHYNSYDYICMEVYDEIFRIGRMKPTLLLPETEKEYLHLVKSYGNRMFQTFCCFLKASDDKEIMLIKNKDNPYMERTYFMSERALRKALNINSENMLKTFNISKYRIFFTEDERIGVIGLFTEESRLKNPLKPVGIWYLDTKEPMCDLLKYGSPDYFQVWQKLKTVLSSGNKTTLAIEVR